jgi:hypothetical protein
MHQLPDWRQPYHQVKYGFGYPKCHHINHQNASGKLAKTAIETAINHRISQA